MWRDDKLAEVDMSVFVYHAPHALAITGTNLRVTVRWLVQAEDGQSTTMTRRATDEQTTTTTKTGRSTDEQRKNGADDGRTEDGDEGTDGQRTGGG